MQEKSDSKNERKGGESLDVVLIRDSGTEEKMGRSRRQQRLNC